MNARLRAWNVNTLIRKQCGRLCTLMLFVFRVFMPRRNKALCPHSTFVVRHSPYKPQTVINLLQQLAVEQKACTLNDKWGFCSVWACKYWPKDNAVFQYYTWTNWKVEGTSHSGYMKSAILNLRTWCHWTQVQFNSHTQDCAAWLWCYACLLGAKSCWTQWNILPNKHVWVTRHTRKTGRDPVCCIIAKCHTEQLAPVKLHKM